MATTTAPGGLGRFSALTRGWFEGAFAAPTQAQGGGWDALAQEQDVLVVAPTGSGKTLAAFLSAIDRLANAPPVPERGRLGVLYISPLTPLVADLARAPPPSLPALARLPPPPPVPERDRLRVLYISPLKALAADIERNLRAPLAG